MTNTKITTKNFLDNKELREQTIARVEVLDKVKQLFLIPEFECMTIKQVADYFETELETIQWQYKNNKDEFDEDGVTIKSPSKFTSCSQTTTRKMVQKRTFLEITLDNDTIIAIPNCGVKCFPKRAILRMGMLLRDSKVAKEVRTQLLNTFEHTTEEQRTAEIDEEQRFLDRIWKAWGSKDIDEVMKASAALDGYRRRYIAEIEHHNAELTQTIDDSKPKVEFYDVVAEKGRNLSVSEFAKIIYGEIDDEMGRNILYKWLRDNGYIRHNNEPYQKYVKAGYFIGKWRSVEINGAIKPKPRLLITPKGQQYLLTKLKT